MTLLLFVILLVIICAIARYNEDNKLFWILLISLLAGITGGAMYQKLTTSDTKSKYEQVSPMSVSPTVLTAVVFDEFETIKERSGNKSQTPTGKGCLYSDIVLNIAQSEGMETIRSQPFKFFDTS